MRFKCSFVLCAAILPLVLSGCARVPPLISGSDVPAVSGVSMTAEKPVYPPDVSAINVTWQNDTDSSWMFGAQFNLETRINGAWEPAFPDKDPVFLLLGLELSPRSTHEQTYDISLYADRLKPGYYRIKSSFSESEAEPGKYHQYPVYAEFSVERPSVIFLQNLLANLIAKISPVRGVSMTTEKPVYPPDVSAINVTWKNDTGNPFMFGAKFYLEEETNGTWNIVPIKGMYSVFLAYGVNLRAHSTVKHTYDIGEYYNTLAAGRYRIAADYDYYRAPGDNDTYHLYAEFSVS